MLIHRGNADACVIIITIVLGQCAIAVREQKQIWDAMSAENKFLAFRIVKGKLDTDRRKIQKYVQFVRRDLIEKLNWGKWDAHAQLDIITVASNNIGIMNHHMTKNAMGWNVWLAMAFQRGLIGFDVNILTYYFNWHFTTACEGNTTIIDQLHCNAGVPAEQFPTHQH